MPDQNHYDVIIIGSGAGGGTLAHKLAPSGKRILIVERGDYVPREKDNWSPKAVNLDGKYQTKEKWFDKDGKELHPHINYYVGGNTKFFGAALFRLRKEDFGEIKHHGGISPAWPISYDDMEPYYSEAEALYHVHGQRNEDPTEPPASRPYPQPPVSHEPRIQQLSDDLARLGLRPFHTPLGVMLDEKNPCASKCIRCETCDGFPCLVYAKADAQVCAVDPALEHENVSLMTNAYVDKLATDASGRRVSKVIVNHNGSNEELSADIVVSACGAINSAALLLRSRNDQTPARLGQRLGYRRPPLHGPYQFSNNGAVEMSQPDDLSEIAFDQRLLLWRRRLELSDGPHLVCRQARRRDAQGRRPGDCARLEFRLNGKALPRLLADFRRSPRPQ